VVLFVTFTAHMIGELLNAMVRQTFGNEHASVVLRTKETRMSAQGSD
jgi:hypothetical protein